MSLTVPTPPRCPSAPPPGTRTAARARLTIFALLLCALPLPIAAQVGAAGADTATAPLRPIPADSYGDASVRALLERARASRAEVAAGLETYEARMRERVYFGVAGELFRRERGIWDQERVSRVRWQRDGNHVVVWEGARLDIPIVGVSSLDPPRPDQPRGGIGGQMVRNLAGEPPEGDDDGDDPAFPPPLLYDPGSDRIVFGGEWALNPLSDTAAYHYRFESGDTLSIGLPGLDRPILLGEVRVQPRRNEFRLVSASLWFDLESGALVRAGYRPARPFDLELDGSDDGDLPPGFLRPIRAEIRYVSVDHGLYDLRWWIPRRSTFEGEAQIAAFARFPITIEWTVEDILPNERTDLIPAEIPEGWILREAEVERDDRTFNVTVLVPTAAELGRSPELTMGTRDAASAFSRAELDELERTLGQLAPPGTFPGVRFAYGTAEGLTRYNRVEGLSTGVSAALPLPGRLDLRAEARFGFADRELGGELRLGRGVPTRREELALFRRLDSSSEWARPQSIGASLASALWGSDFTPFHRSWGVEGIVRREGRPISTELRLFTEWQGPAERETNAHLSRLWTGHDLRENPAADEGNWSGGALRVRWEAGRSPRSVRGFGSVQLEGAGGTTAYGRGWTSAGLTAPFLRRWSWAVEGGIGGTVGDPPPQRLFYPGGPAIFRGAHAGQLSGEAFWFGRAEFGNSLPAIRLVGFVDALAVGPQDGFWRIEPEVAVGAGLSFLDGIFRLDVARNLRGTESWKLFLYLDGLF